MESFVWVGVDLTRVAGGAAWPLLVVIPARFQPLQHLLPKKPQGRRVAVGSPLLRGKGCFQAPLESCGGGADHDWKAEAGAGGRAQWGLWPGTAGLADRVLVPPF